MALKLVGTTVVSTKLVINLWRFSTLEKSYCKKRLVYAVGRLTWLLKTAHLLCKVTTIIIWALQCGMSTESANHRVRMTQAQAVGGPTWGPGGGLSAPTAGSGAEPRPPVIFSYIQIKSELILAIDA